MLFDWKSAPVVRPQSVASEESITAEHMPVSPVSDHSSSMPEPAVEEGSAVTESREVPDDEKPPASTDDYKPAWEWKDQIIHRYSESREGGRSATLRGTVVDSAGRPVAGAQVAVVSSESTDKYRTKGGLAVLGTTGEDGVFENSYGFRGTSIVFEIELRARLNGLESDPLKLAVTPGDTYDDIVITMPDGRSLSGFVVDGNRLPISNAIVSLQPVEGFRDPFRLLAQPSTRTDAQGAFSFTQLAAGDYRLHASSPGYVSATADVKLEESSVQLEHNLVLVSRTSIRFRLVCDGVPVKGGFAAVLYDAAGEAVEHTWFADSNGHAVIANVRVETTELVLRVPGYQETGRIPVSPIDGMHTDIGDVVLESLP